MPDLGVGSLLCTRTATLNCSLEGTIGAIFNLSFDSAVIAVTVYQTVGIPQLQMGVKAMHKKSLTGLLLHQGV
jgi:hypothetical protein